MNKVNQNDNKITETLAKMKRENIKKNRIQT